MNIKINTNDIMMALGYTNTSASDAVLKLADEIAEKTNNIIDPKSIHKIIKIKEVRNFDIVLENDDVLTCESLAEKAKDCSHVLLAVLTIGHEMDSVIKKAFADDDYLEGMMLDAAGTRCVADYARLMWNDYIKIIDDDMGITQAFSPGSQDFDLSQQKIIFKNLDAENIDIKLLDTMLMVPAKSISAVYGIGEKIEKSCILHSCTECPRIECMMRDNREVEMKIHTANQETIFKAPIGRKLIDILNDNNIHIDLTCRGRGTCGSCKLKFIKLIPELSQRDLIQLSKKQLDDGFRLACQIIISHPLEFYVDNSKMQIISDAKVIDSKADKYSIAIDIGTTTIVCHLINHANGDIIDTVGSSNKQRSFGADVASRIFHEMTSPNGKSQLNNSIIGQLNEMIKTLTTNNNAYKIESVTAVGNTVMTHILLGYDIKSLGAAPYTPISLARITKPCRELSINLDADITIMEGFASYVGSDVSVGAAICNIMKDENYSILIDLGTNGEIVLGNSEKLLCCATAAGPAFEAANIYNGMSALPGAISSFKFEDGKFTFETIEGKSPVGICGSGVLDITSALLKEGIIDVTGRMLAENEYVKFNDTVKEYFTLAEGKNGKIIFTAKDVREIQLAKAAIAAGVKTLIDIAGIDFADVKHLHLAGGFGNYLDKKSALDIGLLAREFDGHIISSGNTAAKGAVRSIHDKNFLDRVSDYTKRSEHIELSTSMIFQNNFIEYMGF